MHRTCGLVPLRVEGLHAVAPELNVQKVGGVQKCIVCIADLEMLADHPCELSLSQWSLTVL